MKAKDCKTKDDIYMYLVSNLNSINDNVNVNNYKQILGFRDKMMVHQVWHNIETSKWAFHASDNEFIGNANMGEYNTFIELLEGVITQYAQLWKIES